MATPQKPANVPHTTATPPAANPPPTPASEKAAAPTKGSKFQVGEHVDHPAAKDGSFRAGSGTIETVKDDPKFVHGYTVKCDITGQVLTQEFTEDELKHR